jgi:hypothetical protein
VAVEGKQGEQGAQIIGTDGMMDHGNHSFTSFFYSRASLKILRTTNRWNLFRHSSQNSFAEDELCTRIFVARRMARTDRKIFSSLAARRIFRDAQYWNFGKISPEMSSVLVKPQRSVKGERLWKEKMSGHRSAMRPSWICIGSGMKKQFQKRMQSTEIIYT